MTHILDSWLIWLGLGGGTLGMIALAIFAPSVLQIASNIVTGIVIPMARPIAAMLGKGLAKTGAALWEGALDVLDNGKTIAFVVILAIVAGLWVHVTTARTTRETTIAEMHKHYKFVPKPKQSRWVP